jgi:DNA helicase-2/ATP-dependent DNA helicase PcrA
MLALLRFVQNPRDRVSGFRLMQLLPGVGPTSAQRVLDAMADKPDPPVQSSPDRGGAGMSERALNLGRPGGTALLDRL